MNTVTADTTTDTATADVDASTTDNLNFARRIYAAGRFIVRAIISVISACGDVITKIENFTLAQGQRLWTTINGSWGRVTAWFRSHHNTILWVVGASVIMLTVGIILTYLYFTHPGFRAFVQGIKETITARLRFRTRDQAMAQSGGILETTEEVVTTVFAPNPNSKQPVSAA